LLLQASGLAGIKSGLAAVRNFGLAEFLNGMVRPCSGPAIKLTAVMDAVRGLHFSRKVFCWYTDCCRTPIGNTAGPGFPIVGLIQSVECTPALMAKLEGSGKIAFVVTEAPRNKV
jgi:hypothetical protein